MHREGILMRSKDLAFLRQLVQAPSPSGYEQPAAAVFRDWLKPHADEIETNVMGSVHALLKAKGKAASAPTVMLAGHIDEIGLMVNYISAEGFISFAGIGGVDANVLPGTRVHVHTRDGVLLGLVGRKPIHLLEEDERKAAPKLDKLFVDIGFGGDEAKRRVRVGDPITFADGLQEYGQGLAVSRAFDDKMGAWISAMVLAEVKKAGGAAVNVVAAGTVQEEVGLRGGTTSAYGVNPEIGIAVEVGHATDYPDIDKRKHGEADLGGGPIIARGPNINPLLFDLLVAAADKAKVSYVIGAEPRGTGTDANAIQLSRGGKVAGLVSIPLRYMHTQNEVLSLKDLDAAVKLLTRFVLDLPPGTNFTPMI